MRALTVIPGTPGSAAIEEVAEPPLTDGSILVRAHAVGVCGTDREIIQGHYGAPPPGERHLILGHESVGRVLEAPDDSGFTKGDWVVGIVRRPDPVPCTSCAAGEWDMCRNGQFTEHGIKGLHGFASDRYRLTPRFAVKVPPELGELGVLLEPTSVVAKAWDHIERIGQRAHFAPARVLVTGAGPIGLLAALLGVQRGLEVHVLDQVTEGPKPKLVRALGATYHSGALENLCADSDIVIECTGVPALIVEAISTARANGVVCLTGVSRAGQRTPVDVGGFNRELVLENTVVFGSVNANRSHYDLAVTALQRADPSWLRSFITHRFPLENSRGAIGAKGSVKTIITFDS